MANTVPDEEDDEGQVKKIRKHIDDAEYWLEDLEDNMMSNGLRDSRVEALRTSVVNAQRLLSEYDEGDTDEEEGSGDAEDAKGEDSTYEGVEIDISASANPSHTDTATTSAAAKSLLAGFMAKGDGTDPPIEGTSSTTTFDTLSGKSRFVKPSEYTDAIRGKAMTHQEKLDLMGHGKQFEGDVLQMRKEEAEAEAEAAAATEAEAEAEAAGSSLLDVFNPPKDEEEDQAGGGEGGV